MKIVGLDLSLASTGLCKIHTGYGPHGAVDVDRVTTKPSGDDLRARHQRLRRIRRAVADWCVGASLVVLEGPAFSRSNPGMHDRSGLWWLVTASLMASDFPVAVIPPTSRAKYATGRGNAGKDEVLAAVVRRYPDVETRGNDEADALVLAAMGARALGAPIDDLPAAHLAAMEKVEWPEVVPC